MGDFNLPDDSGFVNTSEIRWTLEPVPPLERIDLLTLTEDETFHYARDLQQEATWLRRLLHAALAHLQVLTAQLTAARHTIRELRRQLLQRRETRT